MRFVLFLFCALCVAYAKYTVLDDALKNGVSNGDVVLYGGYSPGSSASHSFLNSSVGMGYTSGFYYDVRGAVSFRAAKMFRSSPKGSSSIHSSTSDVVALGDSFIEYYDGDTALKVGRFLPMNEFINSSIDGFWVRNASIENMQFEGMWIGRYGKVSYREISDFKSIAWTSKYHRSSLGLIGLGVRHYLSYNQSDFRNSSYLAGYTFYAGDVFAAAGVRLHASRRFFDSKVWTGLDLGLGTSFERENNLYKGNTYAVDFRLMAGISGIDFYLGYLGLGDSGFGSLGMLGVGNGPYQAMNVPNIQPFFAWSNTAIGRAINYGTNAHLFYATAHAHLLDDSLMLYLTYGRTRYKSPVVKKMFWQDEINLMIDTSITRNVDFVMYLSNVNFSFSNGTDISCGIKMNF